MKTPCSEKHEKTYGVPTLEELSHDTTALTKELFPGGEQEALRRLDEHMKRTVFQFLTRQHMGHKRYINQRTNQQLIDLTHVSYISGMGV